MVAGETVLCCGSGDVAALETDGWCRRAVLFAELLASCVASAVLRPSRLLLAGAGGPVGAGVIGAAAPWRSALAVTLTGLGTGYVLGIDPSCAYVYTLPVASWSST